VPGQRAASTAAHRCNTRMLPASRSCRKRTRRKLGGNNWIITVRRRGASGWAASEPGGCRPEPPRRPTRSVGELIGLAPKLSGWPQSRDLGAVNVTAAVIEEFFAERRRDGCARLHTSGSLALLAGCMPAVLTQGHSQRLLDAVSGGSRAVALCSCLVSQGSGISWFRDAASGGTARLPVSCLARNTITGRRCRRPRRGAAR
jgi:hypothetical protein